MTASVHEVMTSDPLTISPDERLEVARAMMVSCRIRHLPVVTHGRVTGMLSARDLLAAPLHAAVSVRDVMHAPVETVTARDSLAVAAARLLDHHFSSLPVVDARALVGIVTTTDLIRLASEQLGTTPVSDLMTRTPLVTVWATDPIDVARLLMKLEHVRHLPVIDGERLVGFLSDLDLLPQHAGSGRTVAEVMPQTLRILAPDQGAAEAGRVLVRERLDALPVAEGDRVCGVLSSLDFVRTFLDESAAVA